VDLQTEQDSGTELGVTYVEQEGVEQAWR